MSDVHPPHPPFPLLFSELNFPLPTVFSHPFPLNTAPLNISSSFSSFGLEIVKKIHPFHHHHSFLIHRFPSTTMPSGSSEGLGFFLQPPLSSSERRCEAFKLCGGFFVAAELCCFGGGLLLCLCVCFYSHVCFVFFLLLDDQRLGRRQTRDSLRWFFFNNQKGSSSVNLKGYVATITYWTQPSIWVLTCDIGCVW